MITIRNPSFQPLAVIERYDNDSVDETINGEYKLNFTALIDPDGKSEYLTDGNLAEVEDQLFNIVHHRRTRAGDGSTMVAVECEQVSYDLLLPEFAWADGFVHAGTPLQLLAMALEDTGFTIGSVELSGYISVDLAEENITTRAILLEIAAQSGGELRFDRYSISLLARRGLIRPVRFQLGKNLKGIVKDVDVRSGERITAYDIDVLELNSLPEFYGLEYFELGDTVGIGDPELGIDEQQRIVGYSYSPRRRINSKVTISNAITGIKDAVVGLRKTTIVKDKAYYGNRFGPEIGFESVRYDKLARSVFNADEFRMQKGNGSGSWTDAIFFNPLEGEYEFTGKIIASSFEGGTIMIGEGDDAFRASLDGIWLGDETFADAPFSVTPGGHMKSVDGEFSGRITAAEIEGGVITGARIRTAASGMRAEMSSTDHLFAAYRDASNFVKIEADFSGAPGVRFTANDLALGAITSYLGHLDVWAATILSLTAPKVQVAGWSNLYSAVDARTLSEELERIYTLLDSKADNSHTHSVSIPNHNHGNPDNLNSGGGTFIVY
ncbi:hypothetical protein ACDZ28_13670 [Paenibacillus sp. RS8]|uniref:hypothetical protein n=1 Tax=Paenibacillus sp. RS8 TaxID=3242681 RepID=UPI0035C240FE